MNITIKDAYVLAGKGKECSLYIQDSKIAGIGQEPPDFVPERIIDGKNKMIIPGLVNSHTHSYMTIFRNYADDLSFHAWLFDKIIPLEDKLTAEDCYWGSLLGIMEMLSTGTTCFLDMYIFPNSVTRAVKESGIRAVVSRGLTGGQDDEDGGARRLREAAEDMENFKGIDTLSFMLAPHAPYTCDEKYQRRVAETASRLGVGIHTHLSESKRENEDIFRVYGCTPAQLMERTGLLTPSTVAAHCVHLTETDVQILRRNGVTVAANPVSNLKLANGIANISTLLDNGINVSIGTDGTASNNSLNMIREMSYNALIHKGITGDPEVVNAMTTIQMASKNGAEAMGLETGEIAVGKKADITLIDLDRPNMQPNNNPVAALVYSANGSETDTVIVNGEVLYEKGEYKTVDKDRVLYEVEKICQKVGMR